MSKLIGMAVRGISTGVGLAGEKYYDHKERKAALAQQGQHGGSSGSVEDHDQERTHDTNAQDDRSIEDAETADDERIWALDDAAALPPAYDETISNPDQVIAELAHTVAAAKDHQVQMHDGHVSRLPNPIIIPQRRPGARARGWTRAYAPDLEPLGIDQDTFMKFLESWDKSAQGSPWFKAITLTANVVGWAMPGPIVMGVTTAVTVAAEVGFELQGRARSNTFLDQMNKDVFMPAGLYAMVIVCKQDASVTGVQLSMDTVNLDNAKNVSKWGLPGDDPASKSAKFTRPIRVASGRANVDEMPLEIAPLIYPGLDDMVKRLELNRDESFKERMMRNKNFVADYFDRRAQADFSGNNPDAALTKAHGDAPEFKTRFADPNNACNNGHLISLVTGGKVVVQGRGLLGLRGGRDRGDGRQRRGFIGSAIAAAGGRQESGFVGSRSRSEGGRGGFLGARESSFDSRRRGNSPGYDYDEGYDDNRRDSRRHERRERREQHRQGRGTQFREVGEDGKLLPKAKQPARQPRGPIGYVLKGAKKALNPDVLYLTIVNLPTEEEMEMAREALGMDKKGWQDIIEGMRRR